MQKTTRYYRILDKNILSVQTLSAGDEKAKIETEFNYKACCNDNTGLQVLGTEVYQPSTCSQRTCFYDKYLPFSLWISKQVRLCFEAPILISSRSSLDVTAV